MTPLTSLRPAKAARKDSCQELLEQLYRLGDEQLGVLSAAVDTAATPMSSSCALPGHSWIHSTKDRSRLVGSASSGTGTTGAVKQDVTTPRKPTKSGTFDPKSGETEMMSSTGKVSKPKTIKTSKGVTIDGGGVKVGISPVRGTTMGKNSAGQMVISGPGRLQISKSGLKPGSKVVVWLRPSMKRLALTKVKADGTVDFGVALPDDLPAGDHMLQIDMVNTDGEQVSMATGFSMSANRMPVTGSEPSGGATPAVLMVLMGAALLLGRRRLRKSPSL